MRRVPSPVKMRSATDKVLLTRSDGRTYSKTRSGTPFAVARPSRVESADEVQLGVGQLGARQRVPKQDENFRLRSHQCLHPP